MVSLGHEVVVSWQSVPCNVLVLAEHDPVNGVTVHGVEEVQVVGLTYLSAPCCPPDTYP